ncbi:MAG: hypothetical protein WCF26_10740 [Candidatus Sulfotelmatobacter sp.]
MTRKFAAIFASVIVLMAVACSKHDPVPQLVVEIPAGFSGNFVLEMGVRGAAPLAQRGDMYVVTVPRTGRVTTSTFLDHPQVVFKNDSDGKVWGYFQYAFSTGDGISVGSKIESFVGTQKEYEAELEGKAIPAGFPPRVIWLRRSVRAQAVESSTRPFTDKLQKKKGRLGARSGSAESFLLSGLFASRADGGSVATASL